MSYSNSTALSIEHFKLINSLEDLNDKSKVNEKQQEQIILNEQINKIKGRLNKTSISTSQTKHDLILILFCNSKLTLSQSNLNLFLPIAIKLVGGGGNNINLSDRKLGYQACIELFNEESHPLKLLLINTIRGDLYASDSLPQAEVRHSMGLRAIISPRLVSSDLIPAVSDRVIELLTSSKSSGAIRRLALAALLSLLSCASEYDTTTLLEQTRELILVALSISNSITSYTSSSNASRPSTTEQSPKVLCAIVSAISKKSILYPIASNEIVLEKLLSILRNITSGEWEENRTDYHGIYCGWLSVKLLNGIEELLDGKEDESVHLSVLSTIIEYLDTVIDKIDLAFGLLLSSLQSISIIPYITYQSLSSSHILILQKILHRILKHLTSSDPNLQSLSLSSLGLIPFQLWSQSSSSSSSSLVESESGSELSSKLKLEPWGEEAWSKIMGYLESKDSGLRKKSLNVLKKVDTNIAQMYIERLIKLLDSNKSNGNTPVELNRRNQTLELILEASTILDLDSTSWYNRLHFIIINILKPSQIRISQVLVLNTIDRFILLMNGQSQMEFSRKLLEDGIWRRDLSLGLILAAVAAEGDTGEQEREEVAKVMLDWLLNEDKTTPTTYIQSLLDPFLISLLRISSRLPTSARTSINSLVQLLSTKDSSNQPSPLFALFSKFNTTTEGNNLILEFVGKESKKKNWTLPEFGEKLEFYLENPSLVPPTTSHSIQLSSSLSSSLNPPLQHHKESPLRYNPYQPPPEPLESEFPSSMTASKNLQTKERTRERLERGGRGSKMSQSLMTAGALALLVDGTESDEEEEEEEQEEEEEEEGGEEEEVIRQKRREGTMTLIQTPPADLLIELSGDPFYDS